MLIKSTQRGTITVTNNGTPVDATISAVVMLNTQLTLLGQTGISDQLRDCRINLNSTTAVRATPPAGGATGDTCVVGFELTEWQ